MARGTSAKKQSEREADEMSNFWNDRAKGPAKPDPLPLLAATSVHMMIHKLAENLPSEAGREVQETNYKAFKRMTERVAT